MSARRGSRAARRAFSQRLIYRFSRAAVRLYAWLMFDSDIVSPSPLPEGPNLVVANHPSVSDPFLLGLVSPQPMKLLVIDSAFAVPMFGTYMRWSGHIPVALRDGREAFEQAHRRLQAGDSVGLFPEGWVSPQGGGFNKPRTGAARLALATGVPVVPVGIHLPRERNWVVSMNVAGRQTVGYWYLRGPLGMTVGRPLRFAGDVEDRDAVASATEVIMQRIISLARESEERLIAQGRVSTSA